MRTILLIEDNVEICENIVEVLELGGYKVISALNGKIGFEYARRRKPDLIVCDILMPEFDGYEVMTAVKRDPKTNGIPLVFMTAQSEKICLEKAMTLGATAYLVKPLDPVLLLQVVKDELNKVALRAVA